MMATLRIPHPIPPATYLDHPQEGSRAARSSTSPIRQARLKGLVRQVNPRAMMKNR